MSKFSVGEVCEVHSAAGWVECSVVATPGMIKQYKDADVPQNSYLIEVPGIVNQICGQVWSATEEHLRKKKPPQRECDRLVKWEDCLWKPKQLEHA